jgi:uncharacterized protein (DUF2141 family)
MITQITGKDASFEFSDIKPGKYAIAVIHDENCNGKLDTNMFEPKVMVFQWCRGHNECSFVF